MNRIGIILLCMVAGAALLATSQAEAFKEYYAFTKIFINGAESIKAKSYNDLLNFAAGSGISLSSSGNTITISSSGPGGDTNTAQIVSAGGVSLWKSRDNATQNTLYGLSEGTNIDFVVNANDIQISATSGGGGKLETNSINGGSARILKSNSTSEDVLKSLTCTGITSCANGTDTITIRTEINSIDSGNAKILKANSTNGETVIKSLTAGSNISITNGTDTITIAASVSGGATVLGANVTGTLPGTDYLVWTIPLTANSGNTISGVITATSTVSGTAVQAGANVTNLNTRGFCHFTSVATTTTDSIDNIVMNTVATGRVTKNGETLWIAGANVAQPIGFECSVTTGPTAGNMRVFISPEVAGATIAAKAGSFYIKGP